MKIFVTGFQRSGTTLTRDLFSKHPDIKHMFHEQCVLKNFSSRKDIKKVKKLPDWYTSNKKNNRGKYRSRITIPIDFDLISDNWGEKVPYYNLTIKKGFNGHLSEYCKLWNKYFYPNCNIVHIIRHPIDVGISTKNRGYSNSISKPILKYKQSVIQCINILNQFPNVITFKYEDLVLNPKKTIKYLFKKCGLRHSNKIVDSIISDDLYWFGYINSKRAFNFKNEDIQPKNYDLENTIKILNKKVSGIRYDLNLKGN